MVELSKQLDDLNNNLFVVLDNLNNIDDQNFESNLKNIGSLISKIEENNTFVKNNAITYELKSKSDLHHRTVKQIKERFDSIIEEKKALQKTISEELAKTINQKKLINYQR